MSLYISAVVLQTPMTSGRIRLMLPADYRAEPEMAEPEMAEPEIAEPEVAQNQAQPPDQHGAWQLPRLTISGMAKILCFILAILLIHAAWVYIVLVAQREGSGGQLVSQLYVPGLKSTTGAHCMLHNTERMLLLCSAGFFNG